MLKEEIFFSGSGLTSTSANHICNLAKEYILSIERQLETLSFYKRTVRSLRGDIDMTPSEGTDPADFAAMPSKLEEVAKAKSLIAWLREAIKARDALLNKISRTSVSEFCELKGIAYPVEPEKPHFLTEDEYLASLSVKDRNRYYSLETQCAVIGKFIHPEGTFAKRRKELAKVTANPHDLGTCGDEAIMYNYIPTVAQSDVEDMFFALQAKHRGYQAELNSLKFKMEKAIKDDEIEKQALYNTQYEEYNGTLQAVVNQMYQYINTESKRISSLKIVIPNDLKEVYDKIVSMGK